MLICLPLGVDDIKNISPASGYLLKANGKYSVRKRTTPILSSIAIKVPTGLFLLLFVITELVLLNGFDTVFVSKTELL